MKKRVVAAMSGGVDSSVAAALLVENGYEVIGLTMQTWPDTVLTQTAGRQRGCCGVDAAMDAFAVCERLGIPHYVLNFQETFKKHVIENFTQQYLAGRTPNPCVRCNEFVKFHVFLEKAVSLGADFLATGHYARVMRDVENGRYQLLKGIDIKKDQSYVLYPLKQEALQMTLFPLGSWTKEEVRAYASRNKLPTALKAESYDICFVPDGNYAEFIKRETENESPPGKIRNEAGEVIGEHRGLIHYTVGQRKGLGIASSAPLYVIAVQPETNTLVVGEEEKLYSNKLRAEEMNWVSTAPPPDPIQALAKIRYHALEAPAVITPLGNEKAEIRFLQPQKAVTPGQSVVFYDGDRVLGGGIIQTCFS